jgi:hypothetical protein
MDTVKLLLWKSINPFRFIPESRRERFVPWAKNQRLIISLPIAIFMLLVQVAWGLFLARGILSIAGWVSSEWGRATVGYAYLAFQFYYITKQGFFTWLLKGARVDYSLTFRRLEHPAEIRQNNGQRWRRLKYYGEAAEVFDPVTRKWYYVPTYRYVDGRWERASNVCHRTGREEFLPNESSQSDPGRIVVDFLRHAFRDFRIVRRISAIR